MELENQKPKELYCYMNISMHLCRKNLGFIKFDLPILLLLFIFIQFSANAYAEEDHKNSSSQFTNVSFSHETFEEKNASVQFQGSSVLDETVYEELDEDSIHILLEKGVKKMQSQEYSLAFKYLQKTMLRAEELDSVRFYILASNNLGNLFYYLNNNDSALYYYYIALERAEENQDLLLQNTLNNNIGIIYSSTGQNVEAKEYFEKALSVSILAKDSLKIAINLSNLGHVKMVLNDLPGAESMLNQSKAYFTQLRDTSGLMSAYTFLGNLFIEYNKLDSALKYFEYAIKLARTGVHQIQMPNFYLNLGITYLSLNLPDTAIAYLDTAYQISMQWQNYSLATNSLHWLIKAYKMLGNFDKALNKAELSNSLKDSLINKETKDALEQSKIRYDFKVKEREYELLRKDSDTRKFFWRLLVAALVIIFALFFIIFRMKLKAAILKREQLAFENKLTKKKLGLEQSKNKDLEVKIETINYELLSKSLLLDNKNQVLESIGNLIEQADTIENAGDVSHLKQLKQHLYRDNIMDRNLEDFRNYFERVHSDFFKNLHRNHKNLSSNDLRFAALIILQFNSKEIAEMLNISPDSVRKRKQRIREKLNLDLGSDLLSYLYSFAK